MLIGNHQARIMTTPNHQGEVKVLVYVQGEVQQRLVSITQLRPESSEEMVICADLAKKAILAIGSEVARITDELSAAHGRLNQVAKYCSSI